MNLTAAMTVESLGIKCPNFAGAETSVAKVSPELALPTAYRT
jgi:hypothetical protein